MLRIYVINGSNLLLKQTNNESDVELLLHLHSFIQYQLIRPNNQSLFDDPNYSILLTLNDSLAM
jgi:hypothetical protein